MDEKPGLYQDYRAAGCGIGPAILAGALICVAAGYGAVEAVRMTTDDRLLAAAIRTLRFLEAHGTGKLATVPAAVDLREAIIAVAGHYESAAEAIEREFAELRQRLVDEAAKDGNR